jgi:hypothetical protein
LGPWDECGDRGGVWRKEIVWHGMVLGVLAYRWGRLCLGAPVLHFQEFGILAALVVRARLWRPTDRRTGKAVFGIA